MHVFLTSSPCNDDVPEGVELPCIFFEKNGFVENLRERVPYPARLVVAAADPWDAELNDEMTQTMADCFEYHGMELSSVELLDGRTEEYAQQLIENCDVLLIGGGHVPTQREFFRRICLRELLREFDGVVIGISAGSMNSARIVYAQPECEGESLDPNYMRFFPGLGLADAMILPHYQKVKNYILDGKRLYEDITMADSMGHRFIAMPDGSYILAEDGREVLYGEGYLVKNGKMRRICRDGESVLL